MATDTTTITRLTAEQLDELAATLNLGTAEQLPDAPLGSTWPGIVRQLVGNLRAANAGNDQLRQLARSLDGQLSDERQAWRDAFASAVAQAGGEIHIHTTTTALELDEALDG